jgi:hypothetical protein
MDIPDVFSPTTAQPQQSSSTTNNNQNMNQPTATNNYTQSYPQPDAFGKGFVPAPQFQGQPMNNNQGMNPGMNNNFGQQQSHNQQQFGQGQGFNNQNFQQPRPNMNNQGFVPAPQFQGQPMNNNQGMNPGMNNNFGQQPMHNQTINNSVNQNQIPNQNIQPVPTYTVTPENVAPFIAVPIANPSPNSTTNRIPKPLVAEAKPTFDPSQFNFDDFDDDLDSNDDQKLNIDSLTADTKYTPSATILDSKKEDNEFTKLEKSIAEKNNDKTDIIDEKKSFEFNDDEEAIPNVEPETEQTSSSESQQNSNNIKPTVIDFGAIRNNVRKNELLEITDKFLESNQNNEKTFSDLVQKQTKILSEFEDINDYVEAMTETILSLNDQMKTRALDIQDLRGQTDIKGASAQSQLDDLGYSLDQIKKDIRAVKVESERGMKEIFSRVAVLEANSFKGDSDIDARVAVLQSKISQLSGGFSKQNNSDSNSSKSQKLARLQNMK